ncbi:MAG: hypothetical protein HQL13_03850 [Candidatus Omnitrophica bacterium]|nr:hypothetical protein [Candidatus Omnitrophota bacterium]
MKKMMFLIMTGLILGLGSARADMAQMKVYKEAYPDAKPKCINCHMDKFPKKEGGHEPNEYGKAVIKAAGTEAPTADAYKKVGPMPRAN